MQKNKVTVKQKNSGSHTSPSNYTKLSINQPNDRYEQEADAIAEKIVQTPAFPPNKLKPSTGMIASSIQKKYVPLEQEEKNKSGMVMRKEFGVNGMQASPNLISKLCFTKGGGFPLPSETRNYMENAFSSDFSKVRVHTDMEASEMNKDINAKAFTYGQDIYFRHENFKPESSEGKILLAHELTHVLQQEGSKSRLKNGGSEIGSLSSNKIIQRDTISDTIIPLYKVVYNEYWKLVLGLATVNQIIPTIARSKQENEIVESVILKDQGEQSESELNDLLRSLLDFEEKIEKTNQEAHNDWAQITKRYNAEKDRLTPLIDEPASVKALELLNAEHDKTSKRVVFAKNYLVSEDLLGLKFMLDSGRHLELGRLYASRNKVSETEVKITDEKEGSELLASAGHVSEYIGDTVTAEAGLRNIYESGAREITKQAIRDVKKGVSVERAARWASQARNDLKVAIRLKGSPIVRALAEARNIRKYGNKIGPTYEKLVSEGKTPKDIIGSAGRSSTKVNKAVSRLKVGGRLLIFIDVAIVTWEVFSAPEGKRLRAAVAAGGGIIGSKISGEYGAELGFEAGEFLAPFLGPEVIIVTTVVGGVGGTIAGGILGHEVAEEVYDVADELVHAGDKWNAYSKSVDEREDKLIRSQSKNAKVNNP